MGQFQTSCSNCLLHSAIAICVPEPTDLLSIRLGSFTWVEAIIALVRDQERENPVTRSQEITAWSAVVKLIIMDAGWLLLLYDE